MKKVIKLAFVAAFVAVAGYGVYANQTSDAMSDLVLANIDAQADNYEKIYLFVVDISCFTEFDKNRDKGFYKTII